MCGNNESYMLRKGEKSSKFPTRENIWVFRFMKKYLLGLLSESLLIKITFGRWMQLWRASYYPLLTAMRRWIGLFLLHSCAGYGPLYWWLIKEVTASDQAGWCNSKLVESSQWFSLAPDALSYWVMDASWLGLSLRAWCRWYTLQALWSCGDKGETVKNEDNVLWKILGLWN